MDKKLTYALIIGILILGAGLFYWYEYRPTKIKEKCSAGAHWDSRTISMTDDEYQKFINNYYDDCLMRFGLK